MIMWRLVGDSVTSQHRCGTTDKTGRFETENIN